MTEPRVTLWSLSGKDDFLAGIVLELAAQIPTSDETLESSLL